MASILYHIIFMATLFAANVGYVSCFCAHHRVTKFWPMHCICSLANAQCMSLFLPPMCCTSSKCVQLIPPTCAFTICIQLICLAYTSKNIKHICSVYAHPISYRRKMNEKLNKYLSYDAFRRKTPLHIMKGIPQMLSES